MFGIGYQEMFIVLVVAMVIFGPSRLPELAGQVGRWVRDFRRMSSDLTGEFQSTFSEIDEVKKSFERELKSAAGELDNAGKSVSGKKPAAKPATAAKTAAAGNKISTRSVGAKAVDTAAKAKMPSLDRSKTAKNGKADGVALVATKADPLVDVSLFEIDFVAPTISKNGNGKLSVVDDDALARVRRRRAAAAYAKRVPA
jgi:Tat protein translocase TatB subunit